MINHQSNQGFSTVELLISLFIAAAFIATGFQLFSVVTKDSAEARLRSKAASIANAAVQERMYLANNPCTPTPPESTLTIATADLPQATGTVTFSCPYGPASKTTRVKAVVQYGSPQQTVEWSLDVNK